MTTETNAPVAEETRQGPVYTPHVDIYEVEDELVLQADMPGVTGSEIDIRFEDGMLTVHGPVKPRHGEKTRFLAREYGVGDFRRTFKVTEMVDASRITAEYTAGVLTLHLPKVEAAKPRKISVNVN